MGINVKENDFRKILRCLRLLAQSGYQFKDKAGFDDLCSRMEAEYEEQRMMTSEETKEMVYWALDNVK